jgi:sulfide:quinone oxidoreductase
MGWRKTEDITVPLKPILERKGITFINREAKGIDADSAKVATALGEIPYDYLVIATGHSPDLKMSQASALKIWAIQRH